MIETVGEPGPAVAVSGREVAVVIWPVGPGSADVRISAVGREVSVVGPAGVPAVLAVVLVDVPVVSGDVQADLAVVRPSHRRVLRRQLLDEWPASMPSGAS